jgi:hypothetical protein
VGSWARKQSWLDVLEMEKTASHRDKVDKGIGDKRQDNMSSCSSDRKGHEIGVRPRSVLRDRGGE